MVLRISAENIKMGLESGEYTEISNDNSGWLLKPPAVIEDVIPGEDDPGSDIIFVNP